VEFAIIMSQTEQIAGDGMPKMTGMADSNAAAVTRATQVAYIKDLVDALAQQGASTQWAASQAMAARIKVEIDALHRTDAPWRRRWTDRPLVTC
jgi:hypothetical protein